MSKMSRISELSKFKIYFEHTPAKLFSLRRVKQRLKKSK